MLSIYFEFTVPKISKLHLNDQQQTYTHTDKKPTTNIWYVVELSKWDKSTSQKYLKAILEDTAIHYSYIIYINNKYPNNYFILTIRKRTEHNILST